MKRSTTVAFLLLSAFGVGAGARELPKPISPLGGHRTSNFTRYIQGPRQKLPRPILVDANDRHRNTWQTHGVRGK